MQQTKAFCRVAIGRMCCTQHNWDSLAAAAVQRGAALRGVEQRLGGRTRLEHAVGPQRRRRQLRCLDDVDVVDLRRRKGQ